MIIIPSQRRIFHSLLFFAGGNIYKDFYEDCNSNHLNVCNQCAIDLIKNTAKTIGILFFFMGMYVIFPLYALIIHNDLQLSCPIYFPFTNLQTTNGIILNILHQVFINGIGITANIGTEILTCMIRNTIWVCTMLICNSIEELSELLQNSESMACLIDLKFRSILIQVQEVDWWVNFIKETFASF